MAENEQRRDAATPSKRKRKLQTVGRMADMLFTFVAALVYIAVLRSGYLSWFGIAVATYVVALTITSFAFSLAGNKRSKIRVAQLMSSSMIMAGIVVAAVLLWPEGHGSWRPYRFEDELSTLEANRAVADRDNAALQYESLFAATDVENRPRSFSGEFGLVRDEFSKYPWKGIDHPEISRWIDSQARAIDRLLLIGKMKSCRWPIQADIFDDHTVPARKLRYCAELLIAAGNRDLGESRLDQALTKYFCLLSIADHLYQQADGILFRTALAFESMTMQMLRRVLVESHLSDAQIERIAEHLLPAADTWAKDGRALLNVEKLRYMNLLARVYEVNGKGHTRFAAGFALSPEDTDSPKPRRRTDRLWRIFHLMNMPLDPKAVGGIADRYFARFDYLFKSGGVPDTDERREPSFWSPDSLSKIVCNPWRWCIETILFDGESYVRLYHLSAKRTVQQRGTWLILGLRKYKNTHGKWPASLGMMSKYVPGEAFLDPTNGGAFVYVRGGDGFKLYSKGPNGIDEGGWDDFVRASNRHEDDIIIWPAVEQGQRKSRNSEDGQAESSVGLGRTKAWLLVTRTVCVTWPNWALKIQAISKAEQ
jgi:hypothetical protein